MTALTVGLGSSPELRGIISGPATFPSSSARAASSSPRGFPIGVGVIKRVSLTAMGFRPSARTNRRQNARADNRRQAATSVFCVCHGFDMCRVTTGAIAAEMVRLKAFWYWPHKQFVGHHMRRSRALFADIESPIARLVEPPQPRPTGIRTARAIHLGPKTVDHRELREAERNGKMGLYIAMSEPAGIMRGTPAPFESRTVTLRDSTGVHGQPPYRLMVGVTGLLSVGAEDLGTGARENPNPATRDDHTDHQCWQGVS